MRNVSSRPSAFADHDAVDGVGFPGRFVAVNYHAAEPWISGRRLPSGWKVCQKALNHEFFLNADDAVVWAGHANVGLEGSAFRQNPRVRCGHVGVGTQDGGDAPIQVPAHCDFFLGCFGVNVHQDYLCRDLLQEVIGYAKWIIVALKEDPALKVNDCIGNAGPSFSLIEAVTRCAFRIIGWTDQPPCGIAVGGLLHVIDNLALIPHVISCGDDTDALLEKLFCDLGCNSKTPGSIFPIRDDQIDPVLSDNLAQVLLDHGPARSAEDVSDKQNAHERPLEKYDGNTCELAT